MIISNAHTDGIVVADAVQFVKVSDTTLTSYRVALNVIVLSPINGVMVGTDLSMLE